MDIGIVVRPIGVKEAHNGIVADGEKNKRMSFEKMVELVRRETSVPMPVLNSLVLEKI